MQKEINLEPNGGNFLTAMAFHWICVAVLIVPILLVLLIAVCNPFWFRDWFFNYIERIVQRITNWLNYRKYHIYLGCDPKIWHSLKGDLE
jgi:hypothetical protein